jgi:hypothetical protein
MQKEQLTNTIGLCIAGGLGLALVCGVGKLVVDLKKNQLRQRQRQLWELD